MAGLGLSSVQCGLHIMWTSVALNRNAPSGGHIVMVTEVESGVQHEVGWGPRLAIGKHTSLVQLKASTNLYSAFVLDTVLALHCNRTTALLVDANRVPAPQGSTPTLQGNCLAVTILVCTSHPGGATNPSSRLLLFPLSKVASITFTFTVSLSQQFVLMCWWVQQTKHHRCHCTRRRRQLSGMRAAPSTASSWGLALLSTCTSRGEGHHWLHARNNLANVGRAPPPRPSRGMRGITGCMFQAT